MAPPRPEDETNAAEIAPAFNDMINNIGIILDRLQRAEIKSPPERYLFPPEARATEADTHTACDTVPVIDLRCLNGQAGREENDSVAREKVLEQIGRAAVEWGCFQVVNHGIPTELLDAMEGQTRKFFSLPVDVKEQGQAPSRLESGYDGKHENCKARVPWMETLLLIHRPSADVHSFTNKIWRDGNDLFRNTLQEYGKAADDLNRQVLNWLAESLGIPDSHFFSTHFEESTGAYGILKLNYYPVSPDPSRTLGVQPHADPGILTLLRQDGVTGLQIRRGAEWLNVPPVPGAIVVTIGDCLQIWSNDKFRSVEHRAVVNDQSARLAVSYFTTTPLSIVLKPPPQVIHHKHPSVYKLGTSGEYLGLYTASAEAAERSVISKGRLLDSFRKDNVGNVHLEIALSPNSKPHAPPGPPPSSS